MTKRHAHVVHLAKHVNMVGLPFGGGPGPGPLWVPLNPAMATYSMQLTNNKKQWAVWRTKTKNAKLTIML